MGKKTDRMYITASEWKSDFGGAKANKSDADFKRLPFSCCAISLVPFEIPVCSPDGIVFDLTNIIPFLKKHAINPVSGKPLLPAQLVKLHVSKNADNQFQCPITYKTFTENTHVVAIKTSGNVYAYEAVEKLNIKTRSWVDLMTGEKFTRKDIITLQDPHQIHLRNINSFHYVKNEIDVVRDSVKIEKASVESRINFIGTTGKILNELEASKIEEQKALQIKKAQENTPSFIKELPKSRKDAHFSTGLAAASLTSMHFTPSTKNEAACVSDQEYLIANVKEKGYVKFKTNLGEINVELYCEEAPKTCYNFIKLAQQGNYNNTTFHRSIRGFMAQGGDPTGTGTGGNSFWGAPFGDEFKNSLEHSSRGILSMANRGINTNTCQFFFTYQAAHHLDKKHTIFGKIVGGMETLDAFENAGTDADDRPLKPILIESVEVFVDPFQNIITLLDESHERKDALALTKDEEVRRILTIEEKKNIYY